jgi:phosphopantothenoylcysteine decarboxylase/phosphopantothenate--cysteine ligase
VNILLGISGSISCYKTYDLTRDLIKKGHNVKVILTSGAENFLKPELFEYLGAIKAYAPSDDFNLSTYDKESSNVLHIDLSNWSDILVIAPTTANTIAKLASGFAHDLLASVFLAFDQKKMIQLYPAMNTKMLSNPLTQRNLSTLNELSNIFVGPTASGELACGEIGAGRLEEILTISDLIETITFKDINKSVLITTGATISKLDEVRYLTTPSSGKTGYEIAKAFLTAGHKVKVLAGKYSTTQLEHLTAHPKFSLEFITSTFDLEKKVKENIQDADVYISSAAINDIAFKELDQKLKKKDINNSLEVTLTPDILKSVVLHKKENQFIIGFAAESEINEAILKEKWNSKPVDILIGNKVSNGLSNNSQLGFDSNEGEYFFVKKGEITNNQKLSKKQLASYILTQVTERHL